MERARCECSLSPQRGEGGVRGDHARDGIGILALIGVLGVPTPHPAFGHLLPVEGRRNAGARVDLSMPVSGYNTFGAFIFSVRGLAIGVTSAHGFAHGFVLIPDRDGFWRGGER